MAISLFMFIFSLFFEVFFRDSIDFEELIEVDIVTTKNKDFFDIVEVIESQSNVFVDSRNGNRNQDGLHEDRISVFHRRLSFGELMTELNSDIRITCLTISRYDILALENFNRQLVVGSLDNGRNHDIFLLGDSSDRFRL